MATKQQRTEKRNEAKATSWDYLGLINTVLTRSNNVFIFYLTNMNRGRSNQSGLLRSRSRSRSISRVGSAGTLRTHDENGNIIDDGPIDTFISTLDSLPDDEWQARTLSFEVLLETLPSDRSLIPGNNNIIPWFQSYTALRRLAKPIGSLLLNARSSVVKHTTHHLAYLVQKVKDLNPPNADSCKYLLKDLLPAVLALHAQTVKTIRTYAFDMMCIIIPLCRFKSGLPTLLERLRKDKSRDVREACIKYLRLIVKYWSSSSDGNEYLTENICQHIGNGIARALLDPAQDIRKEARNAFELFRFKYPKIWNEIVQKKDGILSKDLRLKKSIMNAAIRADAEGHNFDDEYNPSYDEGHDYDAMTVGSGGSKTSINSWNSKSSFRSKSSMGGSTRLGYRATQAKSERSSSRPRQAQGIRAPPVRTSAVSHGSTSTRGASTSTSPFGSAALSPPRNDSKSISRSKSLDEHDGTSKSTTHTSKSSLQRRQPSENYNIANQLLSAHKSYIDELMEALRIEMNTVRNFESLLVQSQNNPTSDGLYGPGEDDVLRYFEAVYSYLDKSALNNSKLRREMERISKSEVN